MKKLFFIFLLGILVINASAQTAEDSVKAVVNKLFDAMKSSDAGLIKSAFADSAILQGFGRTKEGKMLIETESVNDFAESISKLPKGAADEQIKFDVVKVDGPLAIVWASYKFYLNGKFSHCGFDSFQLIKINSEWKIQYLIDTRRRKGCE